MFITTNVYVFTLLGYASSTYKINTYITGDLFSIQ